MVCSLLLDRCVVYFGLYELSGYEGLKDSHQFVLHITNLEINKFFLSQHRGIAFLNSYKVIG